MVDIYIKNNMNTQKLLIQAAIKAMLHENEDGPGSSKLSHMSLGMKVSRVVISGEDVAKFHKQIIDLGKKEYKDDFNVKFHDGPGIIVGTMPTVKIDPFNSKIKQGIKNKGIPIDAVAVDKPQKLKKK
jgi:hypothetical protein